MNFVRTVMLLAVVLTLHNIEEALWLPAWGLRHGLVCIRGVGIRSVRLRTLFAILNRSRRGFFLLLSIKQLIQMLL
jgi:hypothetical protein